MPRPFPNLVRPLLFGHRGACLHAPENTMPSFELAAKNGADILEMDVHTSSDGEVVVHHDATLDRTTNASGPIHALGYEELKSLDAGYRFRGPDGSASYRAKGVFIPRLEDVLTAFPGRGFNIEIKQRTPSMIRPVLDLLEAAGPSDIVLTAGDDDIMRELEALGPGVPLGLSSRQCWSVWKQAWLGSLRQADWVGRSLQVPAWYKGVLPVLSRRVIEQAHRAGVDVHLWTINRPEVARRWLERGVDGIMSDDPGALRAVIRAAR